MINKLNNNLIIFGFGILVIMTFGIISIPNEVKAYNEYSYFNDYSYSLIFEKPSTNPTPSISSIKPNSIEEIQNKVTITIIGNGFTPDSIVRKNNSNRTTTFIDSNHLLVDIYASDVSNQEEFFLTVFNGEPGGGYSNASLFTIENNTASSNNTNNTTNSSSNNNYNSSSNTNTNTSTTSSSSSSYGNNESADNINENYGSLAANAFLGSNSFLPSGLVQWIFLIIIVLLIIFLWRYVHQSKEKYMMEPMKHA